MDTATEKLLPQSVEAEAGVLGSLLIDPVSITQILSFLRADDFYREANRVIYAAIIDLWREKTPADLITLSEELERQGKIADVGGAAYVSSLANQVPTSANIVHYAQIVERKALARRVIHAAGAIAGLAYNEPDNDVLAVSVQRVLTEALARRMGNDSIPIDDAIDLFLDEQLSAMEQGVAAGVQYGMATLDAALMGMKPGELVYLCGRPGSGKSAFAFTIAERVAQACAAQDVGTVEYITLEMRAQQVVGRLLAARAEVDTRVIRANFMRPDGSIDADAWTAIRQAARDARAQLNKYLRVQPRPMTAAEVRLHLERAVTERDCRFAVLDYIGLVRPDETNGRQNEYQRISNLSRDLKQLALELGIPILCLVQMSRESERRANPRPMLSDLRDSGYLEQDGDFILGLYRGAAYMPKMAEADPHFAQFAEMLVLKAREGVAAITLPLRYEGPYTRFDTWPDGWDYREYMGYTPSDEPTKGKGL